MQLKIKKMKKPSLIKQCRAIKYLLVVVFFLIGNAATSVVHAQTSSELTMSVKPVRAYLKIHPGNRSAHTVNIKNTGTIPLTISPSIVDFAPDGRTGSPVLQETTTFPYLDLENNDLSPIQLAPGQEGRLTLSFSVPADAPSQEYPLSILFSANSSNQEFSINSNSTTTGIIASNLVVLVTDQNPEKNITIKSFNSTRFIDSFGSISFSPLAENASFAAATASGSATITNWRNKEIASFPLYPDTILGYSTREIRSLISKAQEIQNEEETIIEPGVFAYNPPFLFGVYKITLTLDNSTDEQTSIQKSQFTVLAFPFSILLVGLLGVGLYAGYKTILKYTSIFS